MEMALSEARKAPGHGDIPVGAVVFDTLTGEVLSARHNEREISKSPTAHAEVLALGDAARAIGSWRLERATLAVTLEPCSMCAGALVASRIGALVFGAADPRAGACGSIYNLTSDPRLNHEFPVSGGVMADEAAALLLDFFAARR